MRFYLFVLAFLSIFGSFTVVFVTVSSISNIYTASIVAILLSCFFIYIHYKIWNFISLLKKQNHLHTKQIKKLKRKISSFEANKKEHIDALFSHIKKPTEKIQQILSVILKSKNSKLTSKLKEALSEISQNSKTIANTVKMHTLSHALENSRLKIPKTDINVKDTVSKIVDEHRKQAIKRGLVLSLKTDIETKTIVYANKEKLEFLIKELLENALKFTTRGMITVFVHDDKKTNKVHIDVIDSGIGIDQNHTNDIFKKYYREEQAISMGAAGAGIGLYLVKQLTCNFGGEVSADCHGKGHGTTVRLTLPILM